MRVQPRPADPADVPPRPTARWNTLVLSSAWSYVAFSAACSVSYLSVLKGAFANDMWWANYTTSGYQALVVDLFNARLTTHGTGDFDLLAPSAAMVKSYATLVATTNVWPTYVRRLVRNELTSVEYAVENLRQLGSYQCMWMFTQYCWVDFQHVFEVAHTSARQQRCYDRYASNGAAYMEAVLRNQVWDDFMQSFGGKSGMFTVAVQNWLDQTDVGREWVAATSVARQRTSVSDEVVYWKANNISRFELQWTNYWHTGISETMVIQNAFGIQQELVLKNIPRTSETWTSLVLYYMPINDLHILSGINRSLIRSANNSFVAPPLFDIELALGISDDTGTHHNQLAVFRQTIGPFFSVDAMYTAVPSSLVSLVDSVTRTVDQAIVIKPSLQKALADIAGIRFDNTPLSWTNNPDLVFYGGNPLCLFGSPLPFAQQAFGFYDACTAQLPLQSTFSTSSVVFAAIAVRNKPNIPALCQHQANPMLCSQSLQALATLAAGISDDAATIPLFQLAHDDISKLEISLIQFASDSQGGNWTLLRHGLLEDASWSFFGWAMLHEWVQGKREVVGFEGDAGTLTLMSAADTPRPFTSSVGTVRASTTIIWYVVGYVTFLLAVVASGCAVCHFQYRQQATNSSILFFFNRIVGAIWVGRPLLFVRGVTAIIMLSTTQLVMSEAESISRFVLKPRSIIETTVIAGEATWVSYVATDFLSVMTHELTKQYSPMSSLATWAILILLEVLAPVQPSASLNRTCVSMDMDQSVACKSAVLFIGDLSRVFINLAVQSLTIVVSLTVVCVVKRLTQNESREARQRHVLGIADHFMKSPATTSPNHHSQVFAVDKVTSVLAGFVPFGWRDERYTFDIKLWTVDVDTLSDRTTKTFVVHQRSFRSSSVLTGPLSIGTSRPSPGVQNLIRRTGMALCILYAIATISSSVLYLQLTQVNMANDMFWASFNMTGAHAFVANWMNEQLSLGVTDNFGRMDSDAINLVGAFTKADAIVRTAPNMGGQIQYAELNTIDATIEGLRSTEACAVPWIFTQYCYVDFDKRWELANSAARQQRCNSMTANGAVFLEGVLRNIKSSDFRQCWGDAFDSAIGDEVRRSQDGKRWLAATMMDTPSLSIQDEAQYWRAKKVLSFDTQWQNFKRIGLINTYTVTNFFGKVNVFTLHSQNTTFRVDIQTTYQMYWGLANDLLAVGRNTSGIGGRSLVRSSPHFAFTNLSMESALDQNQVLLPPFSQIRSAVQDLLGPFGSVDMMVIPIPRQVQNLVNDIFASLRRALAASKASQDSFTSISDPTSKFFPAPKAWTTLGILTFAGTPLCQELRAAEVKLGMASLTSWDSCQLVPTGAALEPSRTHVVAAMILSNATKVVSPEAIVSACALNIQYESGCLDVLSQTYNFVSTFMAQDLDGFHDLSGQATDSVRALNVELIQFGYLQPSDPIQLYRLNMLDPSEVDFVLFSWMFLVDWSVGYREAVSFQGDSGNITLLTEYMKPRESAVNLAEYPINVAVYMRSAVYYISSAMIGVTAMLLVYMVLSLGHIEALNLLELQRVGAIVWVGRPLLFIRSLTAIGLLSTSSLQLHYTGQITHFDVAQLPWYKTMLAANEVTWLVAIVNDIAMVFTQEYTFHYATANSVLVWLVAVSLSFASPVTHSMTIAKRCRAVQVDAQIVCTSGDLSIGSLSRMTTLVSVVLCLNTVCYLATRVLLRKHPPKKQANSIFLYAGARFLFDQSKWVVNDVYFMDRMSAALNGVLTLRLGDTMLALDIKLWRTFRVDMGVATEGIPSHHSRLRWFELALPMALPQAVNTAQE